METVPGSRCCSKVFLGREAKVKVLKGEILSHDVATKKNGSYSPDRWV